MNGNNQNDEVATPSVSKRRRASWPLIILAALFIIVPFLTWYGTWFGRELSDDDIAKYLADEKSPRHVQHALLQIEQRMEKHDPNVRKFYPQVIALTGNPVAEIRKTTAWVMGQDPAAEEFHRALISLLTDSEPLVRRNAALQLVRFGDAAGRPEGHAPSRQVHRSQFTHGSRAELQGRAGPRQAYQRDRQRACTARQER